MPWLRFDLSEAQVLPREPWQLQMFRRSLKKQQKLRALLDLLGDVRGQRCLLITCGDNNGALNWHFRSHGGTWVWGDVAGENLNEIAELLGEPVLRLPADRFPFLDGQFDCAVAIDVLEHLDDDQTFLRELRRVIQPNGRAIVTVPNGDARLVVNRLRSWVGMKPEVYGHRRAGYTLAELSNAVQQAGFSPIGHGAYSRFFTEIMELVINFGYVFALSRKSGRAPVGRIAPTSASELKSHSAAYRLYCLVYPALRALTGLDYLLPSRSGYAVIVEALAPRH
jgi:SAM-dependent methyltransferase